MVSLIDKSGCTAVESREGLVETCQQRNISVGQEPGTFDLQMAGLFQTFPTLLIDAVMNYIDQHNSDPKPFVWRKTAEEIIDKVGRARLALDNAPTE